MGNSKVLVFDIMGQMAHFRTYYTNSSSISYGFPPRTVITGIIAAILGYERDTYYDILSPENCLVSVCLLTPIRKVMQSVNYIRSKEEDKLSIDTYLNRKLNTYPITMEFVLPQKIEEELVKYRIFFSSEDTSLYNSLKAKLESGKSFYSLYLGITELLAEFEYMGEFPMKEPIKEKGISSVVSEELFDIIDFLKGEFSLILERMPINFVIEKGVRRVKDVKKFVYERNAKEIPVKKYEGVFSVGGKNLVWMK